MTDMDKYRALIGAVFWVLAWGVAMHDKPTWQVCIAAIASRAAIWLWIERRGKP